MARQSNHATVVEMGMQLTLQASDELNLAGLVSDRGTWPARSRPERDTARAMSQENVKTVLRGYEAFNRGDLDAAAEGFHPEIEWSGPGVLPEKREIYRGIDGVRRFWGLWQAEFEDFTVEIEEVIEAGEQVIVMAAVSGTGRGSGAHVRSPTFPHVWTIRDGQAVRMEMLRTRTEALEAAGLRE